MIGAIEAGGSKFVCAIGDASGRLQSEERVPTTDPVNTLAAVMASLRRQGAASGTLAAIGVGAFGPLELNGSSPRYGCLSKTPKAGWSGADLTGAFAREFDCPVGIDTDVNAAAIAEHRWGAARDVSSLVYVTVGTGIGAGVLIDGKPLHGLLHPEIGHIFPRRHPLDDRFPGLCAFHEDCLEGLAAGPAIRARSGAPLEELPDAHPQWDIEADYLGQLCATLTLTLSPYRIILGGGVLSSPRLLPLVRSRTRFWLRGYVDRPQLGEDIDRYLVAPALGSRAGVLGALALGMAAALVRESR